MEESQMGFISYGKYTFSSFLSSIISPYLRHSNHYTNDCELWNVSGIKQEESDCNTTPAPHVSRQTISPSCNIYDQVFLVYLSWNICYRSAPPLSVASGRLVTQMVAMIHSIIRAELKGNRTSCQFLKFFVSARKFPRPWWSVSPVDWSQELLIHPVITCMEGLGENSVLIQFDPFSNYFWPLGVYTPMSHKWGVRSLS